MEEKLQITGASAHNLQNISLEIPRNSLVTFTGLSGSGKSSLAFDTIYAEGQRRYLETFSAYVRNFIGNLEKPAVEQITGLSPVIAIEQKTTNKNPRSTVGTVTEIYDLMRLLYARISDAYDVQSGELVEKHSALDIIKIIEKEYANHSITILSPAVKGRKGHYRELFEQIAKKGFVRVRVDGHITYIERRMQLDRYKIHDIEVVIDILNITENNHSRLEKSLQTAFSHGKGSVMIIDNDDRKKEIKEYKAFNQALDASKTSNVPAITTFNDAEPNTFSFNSPYGACPKCNGLGEITQVDIEKIIPDSSLSILQGGLLPIGKYNANSWIFKQLQSLANVYNFSLETPLRDLKQEHLDLILYGSGTTVQSAYDYANFYGITNYIASQFSENLPAGIQKWAASFMNKNVCPQCHGTRLKEESLSFKIDGKNIAEVSSLDLTDLAQWCGSLNEKLPFRKQEVAKEILREINTRIKFLLDVGLGYLNLNRASRTLSGGESQRIRLATQIGSELVNVLYILDEPSIGLHQRDNQRLIASLKRLRDMGNSVIVVEHDKDMIMQSDWVVDIGPAAGINGGKIVAQGTPKQILEQPSITADYLNGKREIEVPKQRRNGNGKELKLLGASGNNLKDVNLTLPLGTFICVTGVSGSGKSSLINQTLHPILSRYFYRSEKQPLPYKSIEGIDNIDKVIEIDQSPIGRTPRSNPATFIGVFDEVRKLFASLPTAKIRNYQAGRFSFNVKGGRCETCQGAGVRTIEMNFLPDVYVTCEDCNGSRYNRETLEVRYKGKSIKDVLNMSFSEAIIFFENHPKIHRQLKVVQDVGLGYITLGQPSTTLSGGESQRIKLAGELGKKDTGNTLYILDEPTTGLHFEDIRILLNVLQRLVEKGNTMVVIEHNLDVIKVADHIIDLGPEGGKDGGYILATGTPEQMIKNSQNSIGSYLTHYLRDKISV
ncbi:MAG: excinuclease ABC subunit UvrA [Bacteroidales bacterium]|jgi:excinuclease ABC subunit A|nr:excinuclease ABC subunit UvrA [Bacteroidales bacterium]